MLHFLESRKEQVHHPTHHETQISTNRLTLAENTTLTPQTSHTLHSSGMQPSTPMRRCSALSAAPRPFLIINSKTALGAPSSPHPLLQWPPNRLHRVDGKPHQNIGRRNRPATERAPGRSTMAVSVHVRTACETWTNFVHAHLAWSKPSAQRTSAKHSA
jgi:hypothetical protein